MAGIKNLLTWINENWASLMAILALGYGIYAKGLATYQDWKNKSEAEKQAELDRLQQKAVEDAKAAVSDLILSFVATAEIAWNDEGSKMGPVKRADVISRIYEEYPILSTVADKEAILAFIDEQIDKALVTVRATMRNESL